MTFDVNQFLDMREQAASKPGFDSSSFLKDFQRGSNNFSRDIGRDQSQDRKGFIRETTEALAGGATDAAELWMRAIRAVDPEGGNDVVRNFATFGLDSIKNFVAKHPSLAPSEDVQKGVKRWWVEGVRSLIPSLAPTALAVGAGVAAAPFTGGTSLPGISAASGALSGAIFGLAEFDKFHEEVEDRIEELGLVGEEAEAMRIQARNPAIYSALTEGGLEAAANALQTLTLGKFLPGKRAIKNVAKAPLKSLFTKTPKEALKTAGKQLATTAIAETGTEFGQAALETKFRRDIGLTDLDSISQGFQAMGPAFVTSLLFFGAGKTTNAFQRYSIRKSLEDAKANPHKRRNAVRQIANTIRATGEPNAEQMAKNLERSAIPFINSKLEMNLDTEVGVQNLIGEYANALRQETISLPHMRKIQSQLEKDLKGEFISDSDRLTATRFAEGVKVVADEFETFQKERAEFEKDLNTAPRAKKNESDMLIDIGNQIIDRKVGEKIENTKPQIEKEKEVTKESQEALLINSRTALGEDTTFEREQKKLEKEADIISEKIKKQAKEEQLLEGAPEQTRIEAAIEAQRREEVAAEKRGETIEPSIEQVIEQKKIEVKAVQPKIEDEKVQTEKPLEQKERLIDVEEEEEVPTVPETQTEEEVLTKEEILTAEEEIPEEAKTITAKMESDVRRELKDPELTPEDRKDLEQILIDAGLEVRKKPTERQRKRIREEIEKALSKQVGVEPVGKARKKAKAVPASEREAELSKISTERSKLVQKLGALRKNKDSAQNDKLIEEVRTQIGELQDRTKELNQESNQIIIEDTVIDIGGEDQTIEQIAAEVIALQEANNIEGSPDLSVIDEAVGVKTVFLGITPSMIKDGQVDLKGRTINGARELATISQVFSNPQFETLRVIYVKNRTIIHHSGISSRLPNQVKTFKGDAKDIDSTRENIGADAVYLIHNHPSGDPTPSIADTQATKDWAKIIKGLRGHVVINSGKFAFISPQGQTQIADIESIRPDLEASIPNKIVTERIKNKTDIARLSKRMQNPKGYVNAVYLSAKNDVRSLQEIPVNFTKTPREMARLIRQQAKLSGSPNIYITFNSQDHIGLVENQEIFRDLIENNIIKDVIFYNENRITSVAKELGIETENNRNFFLGERIESIKLESGGARSAIKGREQSIQEETAAFESQEKKPRKVKRSRLVADNDTIEANRIKDEKLGPSFEARTIKEVYKNWTTNLMVRLRQGIIDQYASLRNLSTDLWKLAHVSTSVNGAVETLFNWGPIKLDKSGVIDIESEVGDNGLRNVLQPLGNELENFLSWVAANRANKLIQPTKEHPKGREQNLTQDEINVLLKLSDGTMKNGKNRLSVYRQVNRNMMKLHKSVLDIAVQTGTINKEERESWDTDFYIPFFRHLEDKVNEVRGPKTLGGLTNQTAIKKLKGSGAPVADMLSNIMMNWNHILGASMKNQVAKKALGLAEKNTIAGGTPVAQRISDEIEIVENEQGQFEIIHVASGKKKGTKETYAEADERAEQIIDQIAQSRVQKGNRVLYIRDNGRKVWYEVNEPNVYQALASMQWDGFRSSAMKAMRKFKRMLTFGVTFSPEFKIRNLLRDTISSVGVSDISVNIADNVFGTGRKSTKADSASAARIRAGGGFIEFGHIYGTDPEKEAAQIRRNLKKENILDNAKGFEKFRILSGKVLRNWQDLGSRLENLNRGALAAQEINKGGSLLEANFKARDLLDLNRHGAFPAIRFLIDVIPFLNARIQGLDKLGRAFVDKGSRQRALLTTGAVAMAGALLYAVYKDDDDFKAREEWDRDTYWWFKLPGSETAFRIPKPFEIGAIGTLAERLIEQFADDKVHGELFVERLKFAITQTFSFDLMPQAVKPVIELIANKSFFTDRPIETLGMQRLSPTERKKAWTSETAIVLSQGLNKIPWDKVHLSPVQVEHLVQSYLGWVGATSIGFVDQVLTQPVLDFPGRPAKRIEEFPLVGSFLRTNPARQTKYSTIFYEQLKEMNQTYADIRNFRTLGETEKALNLARKEKDNLKFRVFANKVQKQIASISKRIKLTRLNRALPSKEKRIQIDRLTEIKNRLLKMSAEKITS